MSARKSLQHKTIFNLVNWINKLDALKHKQNSLKTPIKQILKSFEIERKFQA